MKHRVKEHFRSSPSKPKAYIETHEWLRVDVAMDEWSREFMAVCASLTSEQAQREADSLINAWALPPMTEEMAERIRESF